MKYSIIVKNNGHYERLLYLGYPEARSGVSNPQIPSRIPGVSRVIPPRYPRIFPGVGGSETL